MKNTAASLRELADNLSDADPQDVKNIMRLAADKIYSMKKSLMDALFDDFDTNNAYNNKIAIDKFKCDFPNLWREIK